MASLSKRALFRKLHYDPHPGQWLVHNSTAPRRVLACGARWGKSTCAAYEAVAAALQPCEQSIGWIVGPTLEASDRVFRRVHWAVMQHLKHWVIGANERERSIRLRNLAGGVSELRGKTADHPASLLGEGLDFVIIDEAARLPADIWENCLAPRLIDKRGWALLLSTPRGCNWFYGAFRLGQKGRDPAYESWRAPSWTNPHLPADAIEAERARLSKDSFDQELGSVFVNAPPEPCDRCGGPSQDAPGLLIVRDQERVLACGLCKGVIGPPDYKTMVRKVPGSEPELTIVRLVQHPGPDPEYPEEVRLMLAAGADDRLGGVDLAI